MKAVSPNRQFSSLLEKVANAAALTAAVAFGLSRLFDEGQVDAQPTAPAADEPSNPDEMDTTEYLLSGPNRAQILAALERRRQNQYVVHDLPAA